MFVFELVKLPIGSSSSALNAVERSIIVVIAGRCGERSGRFLTTSAHDLGVTCVSCVLVFGVEKGLSVMSGAGSCCGVVCSHK